MKEFKILIANVLKPVNENRLFLKFGLALAELPYTKVLIVGQKASKFQYSSTNIFFHPIFYFGRKSWKRWQTQITFFQLLKRERPNLMILQTPELLPITLLYKLFFGGRIIYDVLENYFLNYTASSIYASRLRYLTGLIIRILEWIAAPFISHFTLAEKIYAQQLPFVGNRYTILENKTSNPSFLQNVDFHINDSKIWMVFSGILSHTTGILQAVQVFKSIKKAWPELHFRIIGYCPDEDFFSLLNSQISHESAIELIGGSFFVNHEEIIKGLNTSHFGIVSYPASKHIEGKIPTKIYELLYLDLPVLISENSPGFDLMMKSEKAISFKAEEIEGIPIDRIKKKIWKPRFSRKEYLFDQEKLKDLIFQRFILTK